MYVLFLKMVNSFFNNLKMYVLNTIDTIQNISKSCRKNDNFLRYGAIELTLA